MDAIFEILKLILPAVVVFFTAFYTLKNYLDNEQKLKAMEIRKAGQETTMPIRMQAYERLTLFLDRLHLQKLVMRVHGDKVKTAKQFHSDLLNAIRSEFDHNITQQIYVSAKAWEVTERAKDEMIKLVNLASTQLEDNATGLDLSKTLFKMGDELEQLPTTYALAIVRNEARKLFA
ncbi:MAG: hypothetical protein KDD36_08740 [Flavobacteriales bacterium]|nr:hypothetical protein [Flavobacteriales bacterium]